MATQTNTANPKSHTPNTRRLRTLIVVPLCDPAYVYPFPAAEYPLQRLSVLIHDGPLSSRPCCSSHGDAPPGFPLP
jgi:hypothetical protein